MPDPVISSSDAELRQHVQRVLSAHYEVDREIGRGGMGIVYLARDKRLKRSVAVKLLPPELAFRAEIRTRFLREAETAAQLSHPHIVPIYSVDEREGLVYFIMGYVDGGNVATRLVERGALDQEEVRRILREVADALAYAHGRNVVHRDIKPDNILLTVDDGRAVVTDFGIARAVTEGADSRLTATGMAIGTPTYMSPEQAAGEREIDGRTDLYALGVVGYQMLVGEPPFTATSTPALLVKHLSEAPRPLSERCPRVAPDLAQTIMMLLAKNPADRPSTAAALVSALDERQVPGLAPGERGSRAVARAAAPAQVTAPVAAPSDSPTAYERERWLAAPVVEFRKRVAPYLFVNAVIVLMAILGFADLLFVTAIWGVFLAYQYAKLWTEGFDWRDVFKQPSDRMMFDVAAETIDDARALFDKSKRDEVRARDRARRVRATGGVPAAAPPALGRAGHAAGGAHSAPPELAGDYAEAVRRATADRDEIVRLMKSIAKRDRDRLPDVLVSANALVDAVRGLAVSLTELERNGTPGAGDSVEREIVQLEAQANPHDPAFEERVHRLAYLKRQRRALLDGEQRTQREALRLDSCVLALQNIRFDLLRLKSGTQSPQQVTQLAAQAMSLAHDVDGLILAEEMLRTGTRPTRA